MNRLGVRRLVCAWLAVMLAFAPVVGMGAEAILLGDAPDGARLEAAVDAFVERHGDTTAAVSVGVARGGRTLVEKAYGLADMEAGRPADMDSVYEWGSATKLITWVSVMQLAERGKIDLDADVRTYLPDGFLTRLKFDKPITMMNLMHHNAGWEDMLVGLFVSPQSVNDDLGHALGSSEPNQIYEPGAVVAYSNWGVALAGYIVECVSGEKFWQYAQGNVFEPLGMAHTALAPDLSDNAWVKERRALIEGYAGRNPTANRFAIPLYPAGMATGTLPDMLAFAKALTPEDGQTTPLFEQPGTLKALLTPSLRYGTGEPRNCHGFWVLDFGVPLIGHGGNTAAFSAYILLHPDTHTAMVIMTNQANESVYNNELPELLFGAFVPKRGGELPDARALRGLYQSGRVVNTGCVRLYRLMMTIPLLSGTEASLDSGSLLGLRIAFDQIAPNVFELDQTSTIQPIGRVRAAQTEDGGVRLQMPYFEFIRISTFQGVLSYAIVLLFLLALVYFVIALLIEGVRWLALRLRGEKPEPCSMRRAHRILCGLGVAVGVNIALMAINVMTFAPKWAIGISLGFSWIAGIAVAVYLLLLALRTVGLNCTRWKRRVYCWTGLAGAVMVLNIVYWQLFRF